MKHAFSLLHRWRGYGVVFILATGNLAWGDVVHSGLSAGGLFAYTVTFRKAGAPGYWEGKVTMTPTGGATVTHYGLVKNSDFSTVGNIYYDSGSGLAQGSWSTPFLEPVDDVISLEINNDWAAEFEWRGEGTYRLLVLTVTNTSEVWRTAGLFVSEYPGLMLQSRRVGPGQWADFEFLITTDDPNHYFAALVDAAASNAAGAVEIVVPSDDGYDELKVYHDRVIPDMSTATGTATQADGVAGDGEDLGEGFRAYNPATLPRAGVNDPAAAGETGTLTADAMSAIANSIITSNVQVGEKLEQALSKVPAINNAGFISIGNKIETASQTITGVASSIRDGVNLTSTRVNTLISGVGTVNTNLGTTNTRLNTINTSVGTTNSTLSTMNGRLLDISDALDLLVEGTDKLVEFTELQGELMDDTPSTGGMASAGGAAGDEISAVYGAAPGGKGYALAADGAPNLTVAMPAAFGGATFDFNPFQSGRFAGVCAWFRAAVAWLTIGLLGGWVWQQMGEWTRGFSTLKQAKGNAVLGGTGAQATALTAAGILTVIVVTGTTTLLAWSFDDIQFGSFVAAATSNPLATIPTGIMWMLDNLLPVATIITAFIARITFNMYASSVFAVSAAAARFVVP